MDSRDQRIKNSKQTSANPSAGLGLFSLQKSSFNRVFETYGSELVSWLIDNDEKSKPGQSHVPGIRTCRPLLHEKFVCPIVLAVVQGDLPKAEALIQQQPMLSSVKGEAIDYSRRTIRDVTPFQAALCAWDNEMCEMLAKYMDPEEVARQYDEIFPEGIEAQRASQTPFDFSVVVNVISKSSEAHVKAALNKKQNDTTLCQRLNQFRMDFTNRSSQENIFNPQHLIQAFQLYDANFDRWNSNQRDLFWRQVVGFVQRFLPANIAQDFAQGIYWRIVKDETALRSFTFRFEDESIFPLDFDSHSGLGFDYAVIAPSRGAGGVVSVGWVADAFPNYMSNKNISLVSLCNQHRNTTRFAAV